MGNSTITGENLVNEINILSGKINNNLGDILNSFEINELNKVDRDEFIRLVTNYHTTISNNLQASTKILTIIGLIKKKQTVNADITINLKDLYETIHKFSAQTDITTFKNDCEILMNKIHTDSSYSEKIRTNWKFILGGVISAFGAVCLGVLLVLHFIPGVNFVLATTELVLIIIGIITAAASAIVNIFIGVKKTQILKDNIKQLVDKLNELKLNDSKRNKVTMTIDSFKVISKEDLIYIFDDLEKGCSSYINSIDDEINKTIKLC